MSRVFFFLLVFLLKLCANNANRPFQVTSPDPFKMNQIAKIGDSPFPTNPMSDRARGYLLQGKAQTAITNYGNYIDIHYLDGNYFLVSSDEMTEIQIDGNDGFKIEFPGEKSVYLKEILFGNKTGHQVFGINTDIGNNFHIPCKCFF